MRAMHCRCCSVFRIPHRFYATKRKTKSSPYSSTITLPQTTFPQWIAKDKRTDSEKEIQKDARFSSLYSWQEKQKDRPLFVLHDGPPYANGTLHMGHAVNKILKDILNRHKLTTGHRVHYVPGWDCHGLPIELKAVTATEETELKPEEIRLKARKFARAAIEVQKSSFKRWGIMANWSVPYLTYDNHYIVSQVKAFWHLYEKGLLFRDLKPVYWSPAAHTALAEAELEYNPNHTSLSVYMRFQLSKIPAFLQSFTNAWDELPYALIWTTTPWTLPSNEMICFSNKITYSLVSCKNTKKKYIVALSLKEKLEQELSTRFITECNFEGKVLKDATYTHPMKTGELPFLNAEHVTLDKGTGLVHGSPCNGFDDYAVGIEHNLPMANIVDEKGQFTKEAGRILYGQSVLGQGNETVIKMLAQDILAKKEYVHSYPYDWRKKTPVIIRPSLQWFIDTELLKDEAMKCLHEVQVYPTTLAKSLESQLKKRPYWCISRQRVWGVPIPVLYKKSDGDILITKKLVDHWCQLIEKEGASIWWTSPDEFLFPKEILRKENVNLENEYTRGQDILDIWFDSGVSWHCVLKDVDHVADVCVEGTDQARGWFQSSLLTSVALQGKSPYRKILFHGFTVDENKQKMSKSLGNIIDPADIVDGCKDGTSALGADSLRWWVASHAVGHNVIEVKKSVLEESSACVQKIRRTLWFLIGNLHDFNREDLLVSYSELAVIDKYILHRLQNFQTKVLQCYSELSFDNVTSLVLNFIANDVSALYIQTVKDRLYCAETNSVLRRSSQTVCRFLLQHLTHAIAPILPHLAEELYLHHPTNKQRKMQFFQEIWPKSCEIWNNKEIEKTMMTVLSLKHLIDKQTHLQNSRSLEAIIQGPKDLLLQLEALHSSIEAASFSDLCDVFQLASVQLKDESSIIENSTNYLKGTVETFSGNRDISIYLLPSPNAQCCRCRRYVAKNSEVCTQCLRAMSESWK